MDRIDIRTFDEFKRNVQHHTKQEIKYLIDWLDRHNGEYGRKKREYVVVPWGACTDEIFTDEQIDKIKLVNRPDFLLLKTFDNSYLIKWIAPLEIQTMRPDPHRVSYIWIKKEKIERKFDSITKYIATRGQFILIIANTENPGEEEYTLITDREVKKLSKSHPAPSPLHVFGGKMAYPILISKKRWRKLYDPNEPPIFQAKLDEV